MTRFTIICVVLVLTLGVGLSVWAVFGDADRNAMKDEVRDEKWNFLHAEAEREVLDFELKSPVKTTMPEPDPLPKGTTDDGVRGTLLSILAQSDSLKKTGENQQTALNELLKNQENAFNTARDESKDATQAALSLLDNLAKEEEQLNLPVAPIGTELRPDWNAQWSWLSWNGPVARLVFWMWLIVTVNISLCIHLARRERRWWWRSRRGSLRFFLTLLLLLATFAWGLVLLQSAYTLFVIRLPPIGLARGAISQGAERQALRAEIKRLKDKTAKIEQEIGDLRKNVPAEPKLSESLLGKAPTADGPEKEKLDNSDQETAKTLHTILVLAYETKLLADDTETTAANYKDDSDKLPEAVAKRKRQATAWAWIRLLLTVVLVLLGFIPLFLLLRRLRRFRKRAALECPRCCAQEKLEIVVSPVHDERYPEPKYMHCAVCEYDFPVSHRRLPRLCFPTVGLINSGKTHWLLETYAQIDAQRVPTPSSTITKALSLGDQAITKMVQRLHADYRGPGPTRAVEGKLPYPITLLVEDLDPTPSRILLNLFDFGGEVLTRTVVASVLRRRALLMNGFLFFLDPTRPRDEHGLQQDTLQRFAHDSRETRGLPPEQSLDVPVAICLPKLDLLLTQTALSDHTKSWLRKVRQTERLVATRALLRERSRLVQEILPILFPDWSVEKDLAASFGQNYLFFPLTPVGLEESELESADTTDLRDRALAPFGLIEPVLWLLHMHGCQVFG